MPKGVNPESISKGNATAVPSDWQDVFEKGVKGVARYNEQ